MSNWNRGLFISDCQIPFEAEHALDFCLQVQKEFKIPKENIYNVGDELDLYHGSLHKKDPDAELTPRQELALARKKLKEWYKAFPQMKLAISNHGLRYLRKAIDADIPSEVLRCYRELIDAPREWIWRDRWEIKGERAPMIMVHGMGYGGIYGHRHAALDFGVNTIIGHLHANAGVSYINTHNRKIWGMNTGCLIDVDAFAFAYGKYNRSKPVLTVGVVLDGGLTPILIPYEVRK